MAKVHVFICGIGWFFAAVILYIVTAGLVFSFYKDWKGVEKIGAIIGLVPSIGGIYIVFFKCPRKLFLFSGLLTLWSTSFSFIGSILILIGTTQNYNVSDPHYKLVTYLTASFMMMVSLSTFLSLSCCLGVIAKNRQEEDNKLAINEEFKPLLN